jgi:FkbM family methyltransferase
MKSYPLFRLANMAYNRAFWLYYPLYCLYKRISDSGDISLVRQLVKPGDRVVEIGANIGVYAQLFAKLTGPGGEVHAFEPHPRNYKFLLRLTRNHSAVRAHQAAISDQTGFIDLYMSADLNVDHRTYPTAEKRMKQQVACFSLDSYLQERPVDFIKMDIQGHEYKALLGMQHTLHSNARLTMIMELWPYGLREAGATHQEVIDMLCRHNFFLYIVTGKKLVEYADYQFGSKEKEYYTLLATKNKALLGSSKFGKP